MSISSGLLSSILISDIKLTLNTNSWWYLLLAIAAIGLAYLVYRYTLPPVSKVRRTLLWTLRGAALILILLIIFEPVLVYLLNRHEPSSVALLVDRSASMSVRDVNQDRELQLREFLSSSGVRKLADRAKLHYFAFADSSAEVQRDSLHELSIDGVGTNPAEAWLRAEDVLAGENLAAVVMISDGAQNLGPNPVRHAKQSTVPIYAIGIGDTSDRVDAAITELLTNELTYVGSRVPVDIRVRAHGIKGKTSVLHLYGAGGRELSRQTLTFDNQDSEQSVSMSFLAEAAGDVRIKTALDSVSGETMIENNSRSVIVRVLEAKSKVLIFSGPPSADLTALRQTLESDTSLETESFVEAGNGKLLYGKSLPGDDLLEKSNLLILLNFPSRATPQELVNAITRVVERKRIPVLYFFGPDVQKERFGGLSSVIPVEMLKPGIAENRVVMRASVNHPALVGRSPLPADWGELPPALGGVGSFSVSAGSQVVVKLSRESLGVAEDEAAIVFWQHGQSRGAAFLCWGIHRWKLEMASTGSASGFYSDLMSRTTAWLIAPADKQRVRIQTAKKLYSGGERVRFTAQVYGADMSQRDDAAIDLHVTSAERSEVVAMRNRGNGRYDGDFTPWAEGEYRFSGTAAVGFDTLGSDRGLFAVEAYNIELVDPRARFDLLQQIAEVSGGAFVPVRSADSLLATLQFTPKTMTARKEIPLWNRAWMFWIIIALLCAEWVIRKRSGML
jgi:uncharacterized membrane protein (DUF373 family)